MARLCFAIVVLRCFCTFSSALMVLYSEFLLSRLPSLLLD